MTVLIDDPIGVRTDPVTGDIPDGPLVEVRGLEAAAQGMRSRLGICAGEVFTNLNQGVRYRVRDGVTATQAILGQKFDRSKALAEFRLNLLGDPTRSIVGVPGVETLPVLDATFDHNTRELNIQTRATTSFGDTPLDALIKL